MNIPHPLITTYYVGFPSVCCVFCYYWLRIELLWPMTGQHGTRWEFNADVEKKVGGSRRRNVAAEGVTRWHL